MTDQVFSKEEIIATLDSVDTEETACAIDRALGVVDLLVTNFQIDKQQRSSDEACLNGLWSIRRDLEILEAKISAMRNGIDAFYDKILLESIGEST